MQIYVQSWQCPMCLQWIYDNASAESCLKLKPCKASLREARSWLNDKMICYAGEISSQKNVGKGRTDNRSPLDSPQ